MVTPSEQQALRTTGLIMTDDKRLEMIQVIMDGLTLLRKKDDPRLEKFYLDSKILISQHMTKDQDGDYSFTGSFTAEKYPSKSLLRAGQSDVFIRYKPDGEIAWLSWEGKPVPLDGQITLNFANIWLIEYRDRIEEYCNDKRTT